MSSRKKPSPTETTHTNLLGFVIKCILKTPKTFVVLLFICSGNPVNYKLEN